MYERMRRKKEAEERDEPLSSAGDSVEAGVLEPLPDLLQQVPARGAICNVVTGRAAFGRSLYDRRGCPSLLSREDFGILLARVVDTELDRHDTDIIESKGHQAGVASDG